MVIFDWILTICLNISCEVFPDKAGRYKQALYMWHLCCSVLVFLLHLLEILEEIKYSELPIAIEACVWG